MKTMKRRIFVVAPLVLFVSLLVVYSGHAAAANAQFETSNPALDN